MFFESKKTLFSPGRGPVVGIKLTNETLWKVNLGIPNENVDITIFWLLPPSTTHNGPIGLSRQKCFFLNIK